MLWCQALSVQMNLGPTDTQEGCGKLRGHCMDLKGTVTARVCLTKIHTHVAKSDGIVTGIDPNP